MRDERSSYKLIKKMLEDMPKGICRYRVNTYPLSILNVLDFEDILNKIAGEGWELKHIFVTVGMKLVTIWER